MAPNEALKQVSWSLVTSKLSNSSEHEVVLLVVDAALVDDVFIGVVDVVLLDVFELLLACRQAPVAPRASNSFVRPLP